MRSHLLVVAVGLAGCAHFPDARLVQETTMTQRVQGPVVCGPLGFRRVPLQARWGEYVRVTVTAPSALRGNVLVHAGGAAREPQAWSAEGGAALVVDARFPNEDPDARFALQRESPIDITLTGLEAAAGGSCEGAVFTVEHGVLVPSIDEGAWVAELERRGGPALAARRAAARLEQAARRQAHYAAWEARQQVEVSAELIAQAESARLEHYAAWDARRAEAQQGGDMSGASAGEWASMPSSGAPAASAVVQVNGAVAGSESASVEGVGPASSATAVVMVNGAVAGSESASVESVGPSSSATAVVMVNGAVAGSESVSVGSVAPSSIASAVVVVNGAVAGNELASVGSVEPSSSASAVVVVNGAVAGSESTSVGSVEPSSSARAVLLVNGAVSEGESTSVGSVAPSSNATAVVVVNGAAATSESAGEWASIDTVPTATAPAASATAMVIVNGQVVASETAPGSGASGSAATAMVVVNDVDQGVTHGSTAAEWSQPFATHPQVSAESEWARPPSDAYLVPVAVTSESRVAVGAEAAPAPVVLQPPPCPPASTVTVSVDPATDSLLSGMLQLMFDVAASAPLVVHPGHAARPLPSAR